MGNKVFRVHNDGAQNQDWFSSGRINSTLIESITTDGGNGKKLPTSIPSPFARIDLVRTAFSSIKMDNIDGITKNGKAVASDNHKLISDALDIGQILFNYDKHNKDLSMIEWDAKNSLDKLLESSVPSQQHLGETLRLFLDQDKKQYNFDEFDKIYIILYKHKIIGGTSPRTLFFAAPDAPETDIRFGKDQMLDDALLPLYARDENYIKYLYSLSKTPGFNSLFPEFNSYIISTVNKLESYNHKLFDELNKLDTQSFLQGLKGLYFNSSAGQPITAIRNFELKQFEKDTSAIEDNSDFVIKASKSINGPKPLVLPTETLTLPYIYTEDVWDSNTEVPFFDPRILSKRTLPEQDDNYPYHTMNDFLSDVIIKLPYNVNSSKFLTVGSDKFLLPLTETFFEYFTIEDIKSQNLISFKEIGIDSLEVTLNIPIKKGFISYCKKYNVKDRASQDPSNSKGIILNKSFALSLYPASKSNECDINYSVGIADISPETSNPLSIQLYDDSTSRFINGNSITRASSPYKTIQTVVDKSFDIIAVRYGDTLNFLAPKWTEFTMSGGDIYKFSIDFGTTNTHIEYQIDGQGEPRSLDITEVEEQISLLLPSDAPLRTEDVRLVMDGQTHLLQETVPKRIGKNEIVSSPFRTALLQNSNVNYTTPTFTFGHANVGFDYENTEIRKYLKTYTDLKWSTESSNERQVSHYIEELMMICRNKVLQNNGDFSKTKIIWFYPVSMTNNHLRNLRGIWESAFEKVFGISDNNLSDYPESIAPFFHYKNNENIPTAARPSVSIDIGGGTSDIMVYFDDKPQLISSFRFAGNSIFGNGFNGNIKSNGFVSYYLPEITKILEQNKLSDELNILESIFKDYQSSTDLINFFFSLKENKKVQDNHIDIDFSKMLAKNEDFKIIFLLFYSSIVYHIAELMKLKGYKLPRNIVFSGTGSKTLQLIDSSKKLDALTPLFEGIFNSVFESDDSEINVKALNNPKQITCKGGIEMDGDTSVQDLKHTDLIEVNLANLSSPLIQSKRTENPITYEHLSEDYLNGVISNVDSFYEIFMTLNDKVGFKEEFGVSNKSLEILRTLKNKDQIDHLMEGVKQLKVDSAQTEKVAQTLFFYPIIGLIYDLAVELGDNS